MSVQPPEVRQPRLLARPSHGLLARHGWVWLAAPGGALLIVGVVVSGLLGPDAATQHHTAQTITGLGLIVALGVLVIGLPVRAVAVRRHRRDWAPEVPLPTLGGRYAPPASGVALDAGPHHTRNSGRHVVGGVFLTLLSVAAIGLLVVLAVAGLGNGIHAVDLHHSSSAVHLNATLDENTTVYHGRGTSYTDHVSYVIDGKQERGIEIDADGAQLAGETIPILVDPGDPDDPVAASDHGWVDLIGGAFATVVLLFLGLAVIAGFLRRRKRPQGDPGFRRFSRR